MNKCNCGSAIVHSTHTNAMYAGHIHWGSEGYRHYLLALADRFQLVDGEDKVSFTPELARIIRGALIHIAGEMEGEVDG